MKPVGLGYGESLALRTVQNAAEMEKLQFINTN